MPPAGWESVRELLEFTWAGKKVRVGDEMLGSRLVLPGPSGGLIEARWIVLLEEEDLEGEELIIPARGVNEIRSAANQFLKPKKVLWVEGGSFEEEEGVDAGGSSGNGGEE